MATFLPELMFLVHLVPQFVVVEFVERRYGAGAFTIPPDQ